MLCLCSLLAVKITKKNSNILDSGNWSRKAPTQIPPNSFSQQGTECPCSITRLSFTDWPMPAYRPVTHLIRLPHDDKTKTGTHLFFFQFNNFLPNLKSEATNLLTLHPFCLRGVYSFICGQFDPISFLSNSLLFYLQYMCYICLIKGYFYITHICF